MIDMSFKRILLVPTSNTLDQPGAKRLLELAGPETEVEVFEPVYNTHLEAYPVSENETYERLRDRLVQERLAKANELAEALQARGVKSTAAASWDYPLYESIVRRVLKIEADLVVTEPLQGRAGALSHGDWRLLSTCPASVLVVKSDASKAYAKIVAAVDPFHAHAKPDELDDVILRTAKALQALTHAQLKAVHCFVPLAAFVTEPSPEHLPVDDAEMALEEYRREGLVEVVKKAGLERSNAELVRGRPDDALLAMAERGATDLIIMGALSRGRIRDLIIGSTAERLLYHGEVDVLAVKPPGFESAITEHLPDELIVSPIYYPF